MKRNELQTILMPHCRRVPLIPNSFLVNYLLDLIKKEKDIPLLRILRICGFPETTKPQNKKIIKDILEKQFLGEHNALVAARLIRNALENIEKSLQSRYVEILCALRNHNLDYQRLESLIMNHKYSDLLLCLNVNSDHFPNILKGIIHHTFTPYMIKKILDFHGSEEILELFIELFKKENVILDESVNQALSLYTALNRPERNPFLSPVKWAKDIVSLMDISGDEIDKVINVCTQATNKKAFIINTRKLFEASLLSTLDEKLLLTITQNYWADTYIAYKALPNPPLAFDSISNYHIFLEDLGLLMRLKPYITELALNLVAFILEVESIRAEHSNGDDLKNQDNLLIAMGNAIGTITDIIQSKDIIQSENEATHLFYLFERIRSLDLEALTNLNNACFQLNRQAKCRLSAMAIIAANTNMVPIVNEFAYLGIFSDYDDLIFFVVSKQRPEDHDEIVRVVKEAEQTYTDYRNILPYFKQAYQDLKDRVIIRTKKTSYSQNTLPASPLRMLSVYSTNDNEGVTSEAQDMQCDY